MVARRTIMTLSDKTTTKYFIGNRKNKIGEEYYDIDFRFPTPKRGNRLPKHGYLYIRKFRITGNYGSQQVKEIYSGLPNTKKEGFNIIRNYKKLLRRK